MSLYEQLRNYTARGIVPMHMPGHKRNPRFVMENPYSLDITEVEGMDDLHQPSGVIRETMDRMRNFYGTLDTYLLVNGSTSGNQITVASSCERGEVILMDEICHRSVENTAELLGLTSLRLRRPPLEYGSDIRGPVRAGDVENMLRLLLDAGRLPAAVVVTSPTYEGVVSDIRAIAEVAHRYGAILIVDAAHGAHLTLATKAYQAAAREKKQIHLPWPAPATGLGADLVVESLHKTLPSLTQTALLHRCSVRVSDETIRHYQNIFLTSSPSYVLMASADQCLTWQEREGVKAFLQYDANLRKVYQTGPVMMRRVEDGEQKPLMRLLFPEGRDPSKLVFVGRGPRIAGLLRSGGFEPERVLPDRVILMTSPGDAAENLHRLTTWMLES